MAQRTLPRVLGLLDAVTVVIGSIIGSGIFLKVGNVAGALHYFGPIISVWVAVGLVTLCGSLALAELAAMLPRAGGPYVYIREAYGPLPAFLWGWTEFWVVRTGSVGALSCATVIYFNELVPMHRFAQATLAVVIVLGLSGVNMFSTRWGATVQNITSFVKIAFLAGIIVLPFVLADVARPAAEPMWPETASFNLWRGVGVAMIAVLWPYDGWINIAPVAEEIREPQRNVPLALIVGMSLVICVYVGANVGYHMMLSTSEIEQTSRVAADFFRKLFGEVGAQVAAAGVMCSTFGAVNSNMLTGPRIYFAVARDGLLPSAICRVHSQYQTPACAIGIQAVWTTLLIVIFYAWKPDPKAAFDGLTDSVILGGLIFYSMSVAAVYVLRHKRPELPRPYRTWGYPVTPALLLATYALALVTMLIEHGTESASVVGLIAAGAVFYFFSSRRLRRVAAAIAGEVPPM